MSARKKMIKQRLPQIRETLYLIGLSVAIFCAVVDSSVIPYMLGEELLDVILKTLRYFSYALVAASILLYPYYSRASLLTMLAVMLVSIVNARYVGMIVALRLLYTCGITGLDFKRIARIELAVMAVLYVLLFVGSLIGLFENWEFGMETSRPRYCLGFIYSSHATSLFFAIVLLFCYIKGTGLRAWHVIIIALLDYWQFWYSDSRAGSALALLAAVVMYLIRFLPRKDHIHKSRLLRYSFILCAAACLLLTLLYQRGTVDLSGLNSLLSGRLRLQSDALTSFGLHPFGQDIEWYGHGGTGYIQEAPGSAYNYVDSSFMKVLFNYGILLWLFLIAGFTAASVRAARQKDTYLLLCLAFMAFYCTVEQWLFNPGYNPFFVLAGSLFMWGDAPVADFRLPRRVPAAFAEAERET